MPIQNHTLLLCLLLVSVGCSTSPNGGNPQPSSIPITPSAAIETSRMPAKAAMATSTLDLETPPPTVNPSHSLQVESLESPNREWIAQTTFEQEIYRDYHIQFTISRKDGTKIWTILDYWGDGVGYKYAQLHQWSNDSQYIYFTGDRIAGGGCDFFPVDSKWQRLNVDTGQVTDYSLPLGRGHAISPDESTIAYVRLEIPLHISLHSIQSGQEQTVLLPIDSNLDAAQAGDILWISDGSAIILAIATSDGCNSSSLNFYLMRVDVNTLYINELVGNSKDLLHPVRFELPNHLLVRDWNGYTWWMDATSGETIAAP